MMVTNVPQLFYRCRTRFVPMSRKYAADAPTLSSPGLRGIGIPPTDNYVAAVDGYGECLARVVQMPTGDAADV